MIELMILFILLKRDLTMYAIHKHILLVFGAFTNPSFGAIKPALVRLEKRKMITAARNFSDGGKLSVYYSISNDGIKELKKLLSAGFSDNPLQFISDARIKLCCAAFLNSEECACLYKQISNFAYIFKAKAESIMTDEYTPVDFYQRVVLNNTICEYKNFISMIEGLEKENASNS